MREDVETLRRRLYRPDASPEDLASYLAAAPAAPEQERPAPDGSVPYGSAPDGPGDAVQGAEPGAPEAASPEAATPGPPVRTVRSRRRRIVAGAAGAAVVLTLGGLLVTTRQPQPPPTPAVSVAPRAPDDAMVVLPSVVDGGAQPHATGDAREVGPERYRYDVAAGDTVIGVAARFGLCRSEVVIAIPDGGRWPVVEPGEVLLLQRHRDVVLADGWAGC